MKTTTKKTIGILTTALFALGFSFQSVAAEEAAPKKVDVQGLEKRYWAPKDKKFTVVQNRTYSKTKKIAVSVMPGVMLTEDYSEGFNLDLGVSYFFNDRYGLEFEFQEVLLDDNDLVSEVIRLGGFPDHGKLTRYIGLTGKWLPFYAKMSFLGNRIVYFDMSFGLSAGYSFYEQQFEDESKNEEQGAPTLGLEVSQNFYLTKKLALRVDYKNRWHQQEIVVGADNSQEGQKIEDRLESSSSLNFGLTLIF